MTKITLFHFLDRTIAVYRMAIGCFGAEPVESTEGCAGPDRFRRSERLINPW